jgi:hypothetical protein
MLKLTNRISRHDLSGYAVLIRTPFSKDSPKPSATVKVAVYSHEGELCEPLEPQLALIIAHEATEMRIPFVTSSTVCHYFP